MDFIKTNKTYNEFWAETQKRLGRTIPFDAGVQEANATSFKGLLFAQLSHLYVMYIMLLKDLDKCHDQILQPQKRPLIRKLVELCTGRVLELKHELAELDISDYNYLDNVLVELKLTPFDLQLNPPTFFRSDRAEEIEERNKFIQKVREENELPLFPWQQPEPPRPPPMSREEAVLTVQRHERARQGRYAAAVWLDVYKIKKKMALGIPPDKLDEKVVEKAATLVQKIWRGYISRKKYKQRLTRESLLIGMKTPSWIPPYAFQRAEEVLNLRRALRVKHQKEYEQANVYEKEKFMKVKGPFLTEEYTDEIRAWFIDWYEKCGRFPDFPPEEEGGSLKLVNGEVETPEKYLEKLEEKRLEEERMSKMPPKKGKGPEKPKETKPPEKEEEEEKPKKKRKLDEDKFAAKESVFTLPMHQANLEYRDIWSTKDETENPGQMHDLNTILIEKKEECEMEIRQAVDAMMRLELAVLNDALERDRWKRLGRKRPRKGKRGGKKGGGKGAAKKGKDLTAERTTESLFEELVANGVIRPYPEVYMKDYLAEYAYANYDLRRLYKDPLPSAGEVKQVITEYCILPMGSQMLHQLTPLTPSVCILGPKGSGKRMLVNAICTELGAIMFDLSPKNIAGKYPGKEGLKMLLHLVEKMSRILQPSILFMDGAEKPFYKKVPKEERRLDPKRLAKQLPKLIKAITPEDQVMLVGITSAPWDARPPMIKLYSRFILLPRADYGTIQLVWNELLMKYHGVDRDFPTTALAAVTQGCSISSIKECVNKYMTVKRILRLRIEPLTPHELLEAIVREPCVTQEDQDRLYEWYKTKTPLGKKRTEILEQEATQRLLLEKLNKKKGGNA